MRALTTDEVTGHGQHACTWHEFGERIALAKASRARVGVHHALTFLSPRVYEYKQHISHFTHTHTHKSQKRVACRACVVWTEGKATCPDVELFIHATCGLPEPRGVAS